MHNINQQYNYSEVAVSYTILTNNTTTERLRTHMLKQIIHGNFI